MASLQNDKQPVLEQVSNQRVDANEAVEADDTGTEQLGNNTTAPTTPRSSGSIRNAFQALMSSPSRKTTAQDNQSKRSKTNASPSQHLTKPGRNGLGAYLSKPASYGSSVIYHNDKFVVIKDMYPKSVVHLLLLPRTERNTLHPFTAFQDRDLLDATKTEAAKVKTFVAEELRRLYGRFSETEKARRDAIASGVDGDLPPGRDWEKDVLIGVHAGPSMNHLHVHILSRDRVSACMRHRKHYNSFNTNFFVSLEELPLAEDDPRWAANRGGGLSEDLRCWRCSQNFSNKFERLKTHLAEEFEHWKRE